MRAERTWQTSTNDTRRYPMVIDQEGFDHRASIDTNLCIAVYNTRHLFSEVQIVAKPLPSVDLLD